MDYCSKNLLFVLKAIFPFIKYKVTSKSKVTNVIRNPRLRYGVLYTKEILLEPLFNFKRIKSLAKVAG